MPAQDIKNIAERLIATRVAYSAVTGNPKLSAAKFSALLDVEPERYRRYERGEVEPSIEVLQRLRALTGISLDYLLCGLGGGIEEPERFTGVCTADFGERLRLVRLLFESDVDVIAQVMGVSTMLYKRWESGASVMPTKKKAEFAHRFSVSTTFLDSGLPHGIAWSVLRQITRKYPTLWRADNFRMEPADNRKVYRLSHARRASTPNPAGSRKARVKSA